MKAAQHKRAAKTALKGKWGAAIGVFFIYTILSGITGFVPEEYWWLALIVIIFISGPLSVGYNWFHLDLLRMPNARIEVLFDGFSKGFWRNVLAPVLVGIFTGLWTLLLIIPGIIKSFSYSMTYYIMRDRPDLSVLEAITESRRLMDGKKANLFFLMLSYIWWYIAPIAILIVSGVLLNVGEEESLGLLFLGLGMIILFFVVIFAISIYVTPYYTTAVAAFYEDFVKPKPQEDEYTLSLDKDATHVEDENL